MSRHKDKRPPSDPQRRILNAETAFTAAAHELVTALHGAGWHPSQAVQRMGELLQETLQRFVAERSSPPHTHG